MSHKSQGRLQIVPEVSRNCWKLLLELPVVFHKSLVNLQLLQPGVTHKSFVTRLGLPVVTRKSLEIPLMVRPAGTRKSLATGPERLGVIHRNLCCC